MAEVIEFWAEDGVMLDGYIVKSNEVSNKVLIEIHGMTSNCFKHRERTIANYVAKIGYNTISFNTRGSEIVKNIKYKDGTKKLGGTAYEDIEESYYDIVGAIKYAISLGYNDIFLQGHSLGATKVLYTYNRLQKENSELLKNIKSIILLSLVDVPRLVRFGATNEVINNARLKNNQMELLYTQSFLQMMSVKTLLKYVDNCESFDFAKYSDENYDFNVLNSVQCPLFMRWGDTNELIEFSAKRIVEIVRNKLNNQNSSIDFIKGANHSYSGKENELANQICNFLN